MQSLLNSFHVWRLSQPRICSQIRFFLFKNILIFLKALDPCSARKRSERNPFVGVFDVNPVTNDWLTVGRSPISLSLSLRVGSMFIRFKILGSKSVDLNVHMFVSVLSSILSRCDSYKISILSSRNLRGNVFKSRYLCIELPTFWTGLYIRHVRLYYVLPYGQGSVSIWIVVQSILVDPTDRQTTQRFSRCWTVPAA